MVSRLVAPHKRLRRLRVGSRVDYEKTKHTQSEHLSHGKGSYEKLHRVARQKSANPAGIAAAEKGR